MNHDVPMVVERPREPTGVRHVLSLALGAVAVASLILQHGFEFLRHFWALFTWLDVLLAFGFVGVLVLHFLSARSWRDAVHERRFELPLVGLCQGTRSMSTVPLLKSTGSEICSCVINHLEFERWQQIVERSQN